MRYTSNFTPPDTLTADANTRALYHFNESAGSTSFADSSGNGFGLAGVNGAQTGTAGACTSPAITDERIALGLTSIGSDVGWIATRSGGPGYDARSWTRLPWAD